MSVRTAAGSGAIAVAAAVALVLLGACGGDDSGRSGQTRPLLGSVSASPTERPAEPDEPDADAAVAAYLSWLEALQSHDAATACTIQHPELTIALRQEAILLDRAELGEACTGFEALLWEDPLREYDPTALETTQRTDEKATLAATFAGGEETVLMEYQRAAWRVLEVRRRTSGTADTARWLDAWCDLSLGSTSAQAVAAMGAPSGEYSVADGGEPQLWWAADQYDFRAYLDPVDDTVTDLVGDYDALSAADRSQLTCPELR